jgi:hypothetical protein
MSKTQKVNQTKKNDLPIVIEDRPDQTFGKVDKRKREDNDDDNQPEKKNNINNNYNIDKFLEMKSYEFNNYIFEKALKNTFDNNNEIIEFLENYKNFEIIKQSTINKLEKAFFKKRSQEGYEKYKKFKNEVIKNPKMGNQFMISNLTNLLEEYEEENED